MCCGDVAALVHRLVSPPHHGSTHHPPHEQLLVRLGVGGVSLGPRHRRCASVVAVVVVVRLLALVLKACRGAWWACCP